LLLNVLLIVDEALAAFAEVAEVALEFKFAYNAEFGLKGCCDRTASRL
jgi:hypothetical protein